MSSIEEIPIYLRTKTGEPESPRMMAWISSTQKKLLRAFPDGERLFCRIIDKMISRMPKWKSRLWYTRQKPFKVAPGIVFFGDFYFRNLRLLVEIDGGSHRGPDATEKDEWRSRLITAWKAKTIRISNDMVAGDFRQVESWFVENALECLPISVKLKLADDYRRMRSFHQHIYCPN